MELIDTHAHLDFPEFDKNREEVIARASGEGVRIVNCCLNPEGLEKVRRFKELYLTIGCTPYRLEDFSGQFKLIRDNADDIVAVGEIGLDYHWIKDEGERERERENFTVLLKLAKELDKPVLIHSRNAESPALDLLEKTRVERAIMHCFSGSVDEAARAMDLGYLISIPTNVTRSKQKQAFARGLPLESVVLETDSPYLAPEPRTVNEPANVRISAQKIADIRGVEFEEVARQTTRNARKFFGI